MIKEEQSKPTSIKNRYGEGEQGRTFVFDSRVSVDVPILISDIDTVINSIDKRHAH